MNSFFKFVKVKSSPSPSTSPSTAAAATTTSPPSTATPTLGSSSAPEIPEGLPLGAGAETANFFNSKLEQIRTERIRLAEKAKKAENDLLSESGKCTTFSNEWRALTSELSTTLPTIAMTISQLKTRIDALLESVEVIEAGITLELENVMKLQTEEAVNKAKTDKENLKTKREKERTRLEQSLVDAVNRVKEGTENEVKRKEEDKRKRVEDAFDRASQEDLKSWKKGLVKTNTAQSQEQKPATNPSLTPPLEEENRNLESFLSNVAPLQETTTTTTTEEAPIEPQQSPPPQENSTSNDVVVPKITQDAADL